MRTRKTRKRRKNMDS